ncbi:DEAD/DEAH box helicase family protein [Pseudomonas cremoricolorata]|uniref:DEAD/DEAH box helicase family protein n=1 Tax=Pseudomonas cremoricolorata TaxID=157783 RepID=UPI0004079642|nr:DEAD/DEAH box helicase family protein [Pseudomonas cremoricolorata]
MVDFRSRLKNKTAERKTHPIEIYDSLDRRSEAGPLRPSQHAILDAWHNDHRSKRDNIIKLHTGEGKTLIGLLLLQAKLNETQEPSLFVCPNIYLANQVRLEARKFGIPFCEIGSDGEVPDDFVVGKSILITHVQKLFNGKTKFGLFNKSIAVGSVVLDDSHACIDSIRSSLTVTIPKDHEIYKKLLQIFESDLREQGEGSYLEIENGTYNTMLPVPYWSWIERKDEITRLLLEYREYKKIAFAWELIKNQLNHCQAFFSGNHLEISPILMPIGAFGSFAKAKQRILMSATTQDDSFAIKGLGFDIKAVEQPLTNPTLRWSGEKMILIPSLIDTTLDREFIVDWLARPLTKKKFGIVFLTPDFSKEAQYSKLGAQVAKTETIFSIVQDLKNGKVENSVVFANRYDGIDLPDDACRILVLDSKPYFDSLLDRYEEECRIESDIINIKVAQKVEQGLGRSVRGEKDYSIIIITGGNLTKFIKSQSTKRYFSSQTQKQIDIGLQIASFAKEETEKEADLKKILFSTINQCLQRDDAWKEFYVEEMEGIDDASRREALYDVLKIEYDAEVLYAAGKFDKACEIMQNLSDRFSSNPTEKAWYLQQLARYKFSTSKIESNTIQATAFGLNTHLLKPKSGITYKKINYINENRLSRIKDWLKSFKSSEEFQLTISDILDNLAFGVASEKFEAAIKQVGEALGFISQRPDKEIKKGPDNLWCVAPNSYIMLESKNEVESNRVEINKHEAGQMNTHCGWFTENYGDASCKRILIIPTKKLSYHANFTHEVEIMRRTSLNKLRDNFKSFTTELISYDLETISDGKLNKLIDYYKLDVESLLSDYSVKHTKSAS